MPGQGQRTAVQWYDQHRAMVDDDSMGKTTQAWKKPASTSHHLLSTGTESGVRLWEVAMSV